MNYMRQVAVAPGITVDAKDLEKKWEQVLVHHHLAGNAVLTLVRDSKERDPEPYWEIETCFYGERPVYYYGNAVQWSGYRHWRTIDATLAALSVLGLLWAAERPVTAFESIVKEMEDR